jgi:hypothetical protein
VFLSKGVDAAGIADEIASNARWSFGLVSVASIVAVDMEDGDLVGF